MNTAQNGLTRIICLDAHVPKKLMTIKVSEHANLSGTNGAGKTTLLKLTPFFTAPAPQMLFPVNLPAHGLLIITCPTQPV